MEKYCDKVCVIKKGKIVQIEKLEDIGRQGKIKVSYMQKNGTKTTFIHNGDINSLVRDIAGLDLVDLEITKTALSEDFMRYYGEDDAL